MSDSSTTIHDRLEDILESIELIQEWSKGRTSVDDFMTSSFKIMCQITIALIIRTLERVPFRIGNGLETT